MDKLAICHVGTVPSTCRDVREFTNHVPKRADTSAMRGSLRGTCRHVRTRAKACALAQHVAAGFVPSLRDMRGHVQRFADAVRTRAVARRSLPNTCRHVQLVARHVPKYEPTRPKTRAHVRPVTAPCVRIWSCATRSDSLQYVPRFTKYLRERAGPCWTFTKHPE
jgi:hypothetical protein